MQIYEGYQPTYPCWEVYQNWCWGKWKKKWFVFCIGCKELVCKVAVQKTFTKTHWGITMIECFIRKEKLFITSVFLWNLSMFLEQLFPCTTLKSCSHNSRNTFHTENEKYFMVIWRFSCLPQVKYQKLLQKFLTFSFTKDFCFWIYGAIRVSLHKKLSFV